MAEASKAKAKAKALQPGAGRRVAPAATLAGNTRIRKPLNGHRTRRTDQQWLHDGRQKVCHVLVELVASACAQSGSLDIFEEVEVLQHSISSKM